MDAEPVPELISISEAARLLDISTSTAKHLAAEGKLIGCCGKVGSQWKVNRRVLMEFIDGPQKSR